MQVAVPSLGVCALYCTTLTSPHLTLQGDRKARDGTSGLLAERFGITPKAVRDIWNLRTWWGITEPYWTTDDYKFSLQNYPDRPLSYNPSPHRQDCATDWTYPATHVSHCEGAQAGGWTVGDEIDLELAFLPPPEKDLLENNDMML